MRGGTEKNKIAGTATRRLGVDLCGRRREPDPPGEIDPRRGLRPSQMQSDNVQKRSEERKRKPRNQNSSVPHPRKSIPRGLRTKKGRVFPQPVQTRGFS